MSLVTLHSGTRFDAIVGPYFIRLWLQQEDELKQAGMLPGGILTPGSAMGLVLVKRLQSAGFKFEIERDDSKKH